MPLAAGLAPRAPGSACLTPVDVPGLGPACPSAGGWTVTFPDGRTAFTHGADPIPAARTVAPAALPDPGLACVDASEPHIRVVYVAPPNPSLLSTGGFAREAPQIIAGVEHANAIVYANAQKFGVEMRWKVLCTPEGVLQIDQVVASTPAASTDFYTLVNDLQSMGYSGPNEKVLVFYDGSWNACGCGGWSFIPGGDEASPTNWNNYGYWSFSAIFLGNYLYAPEWAIDEVILHEMTHGMGGVQMSAPHTSGGWHCNDGWDIMCYRDGGSRSAYTTNCFPVGFTDAGAAMPYDCGNDDYFHPNPAPGSYLDTHWNVGASYNRFLARG